MSKFKSIINSDVPVLIDFYADWCGPCRVLSPEVQKAAKLLGDSAKVLKINVDKNPAVSQAYKIQSIPTLMIFKNGQLLWRKAGTMSAHQISETVKKFINHVRIPFQFVFEQKQTPSHPSIDATRSSNCRCSHFS